MNKKLVRKIEIVWELQAKIDKLVGEIYQEDNFEGDKLVSQLSEREG
jgi:hypothetical protein